MYSSLMHMNKNRMPAIKYAKALRNGMGLLNLAMALASSQHADGSVFMFEHPIHVSSWQVESVASLRRLEHVMDVDLTSAP